VQDADQQFELANLLVSEFAQLALERRAFGHVFDRHENARNDVRFDDAAKVEVQVLERVRAAAVGVVTLTSTSSSGLTLRTVRSFFEGVEEQREVVARGLEHPVGKQAAGKR
jgi:hypothetical protein